MFISEAWAQAAGGGGGGLESIQSFLPLILIFVVFYFLMIRPQQAKAKKHKQMVKELRRGDRVLTQGGIFGTVAKSINDAELQVEIAEGVRVRVLRTSVSEVLAKTQPLSKEGAKDDKASDEAGASDGGGEDKDAANEQQDAAPPAPPAPQGIVGLLSKLLGGR